jgi:hypothetical protein
MKMTHLFVWGILGGLLLLAAGQSQAAPRIEFVGGATFDFGDVQVRQKLEHVFVFKNTGDAVLRVQQVSGG